MTVLKKIKYINYIRNLFNPEYTCAMCKNCNIDLYKEQFPPNFLLDNISCIIHNNKIDINSIKCNEFMPIEKYSYGYNINES